MATAVLTTSIEEALHELAKYLVPLDQSKFSPLGCYEEPLRANRPVTLQGRGYFVSLGGTIVRLTLPEQILFFQLLESKYGLLEHGSLERQLMTAYSQEGQTYKNNVLVPFMVYTGEMGIKSKGGHEFGRVVKVEPIVSIVFEDETPTQSGIGDYKFVLRRSRVYVPVNVEDKGQFHQIGKTRGEGHWNGVSPDIQGRSAVSCNWKSSERWLYASADWPLITGDNHALGVWRKAS